MRALEAVGAFLYDFLVGDDPKIAVMVATVLVAGGVLVVAGTGTGLVTVGVAVALVLGFAAVLLLDVHRSERH